MISRLLGDVDHLGILRENGKNTGRKMRIMGFPFLL
jgi:hypothetical protein